MAPELRYETGNIFARILRKEIPCTPLYEDTYALAFADIAPKAPHHILIIPRGPYRDAGHFGACASDEEITGFWRAVSAVMAQVDPNQEGLRLIANQGHHGGQEVPHFHVHLLAGRPLGPMLTQPLEG